MSIARDRVKDSGGDPNGNNLNYVWNFSRYGAENSYRTNEDIDVEMGRKEEYLSNFTFNSTSIRNGFIRKVFALVATMLFVTTLITSIPYMHRDIRYFVQRSFLLYIVSWILFFTVYVVIMCFESVRSCFGILFLCSFIVFVLGVVSVIAALVFKIRWLYTAYASVSALLFMAYLAVDIQMIMGGRKYELSPEEYIFAAITVFTDVVYIFWMLLGVLGDIQND
uniref:Uncharacterized protein n=1 Tax=Setaria digitata TaxID=48799 RepID=A0A915Q697_9BILA